MTARVVSPYTMPAAPDGRRQGPAPSPPIPMPASPARDIPAGGDRSFHGHHAASEDDGSSGMGVGGFDEEGMGGMPMGMAAYAASAPTHGGFGAFAASPHEASPGSGEFRTGGAFTPMPVGAAPMHGSAPTLSGGLHRLAGRSLSFDGAGGSGASSGGDGSVVMPTPGGPSGPFGTHGGGARAGALFARDGGGGEGLSAIGGGFGGGAGASEAGASAKAHGDDFGARGGGGPSFASAPAAVGGFNGGSDGAALMAQAARGGFSDGSSDGSSDGFGHSSSAGMSSGSGGFADDGLSSSAPSPGILGVATDASGDGSGAADGMGMGAGASAGAGADLHGVDGGEGGSDAGMSDGVPSGGTRARSVSAPAPRRRPRAASLPPSALSLFTISEDSTDGSEPSDEPRDALSPTSGAPSPEMLDLLGRCVQLYSKAVAVKAQADSSVRPLSPDTVSRMGEMFQRAADPSIGHKLLDRALTIFREVLGDGHPSVASAYKLGGCIHVQCRQYDAALLKFQPAVDICERAFGPGHGVTVDVVYNIALLHSYRGDYGASVANFERVLAAYEANSGPGDATTERVRAKLETARRAYVQSQYTTRFQQALSLQAAGRVDDAVNTFVSCLELVPNDVIVAYNVAACFAQAAAAGVAAAGAGDGGVAAADSCVQWLGRAAEFGFRDVEMLMGDADFAAMHAHAGFQQMVTAIMGHVEGGG